MTKWIFPIITVLLLASCGSMESSDDKLKIANASMQRGEYQNAINLAKQVLQNEAGNAAARFLLGQIYYEIGNYQPASKEFDKAYENGMNNHELQYLRFSSLRRSLAFNDLKNLLADNNANGQLSESDKLSIQGWIKLGAGELEAAKALFTDSLNKDANNLESLLGQVQYLIDGRKFSESLAAVDAVLAKHAGNSEATLLKATILADQGDLVVATDLLKSLLAKEPKSVATRRGMTARFTLIHVLRKQDKQDEAGEMAKEAFRLMPDSPQSLYVMGYEYFRNKNYTSAKELLTKLINKVPSNNPTLFLLGSINFEEGNWEQASFYLNRFLNDNPGHKQAAKMLGATQMQLRQADAVLETLQPVLEEGDFGVMSLAGAASLAAGDVEKGIDFLKSARDKEPDNATIRIQLAKAYFKMGDKKSAEKELSSVLSLEKGAEQALSMLTNMYVEDNNFKSAFALIDSELKKHPNSPFHYTLKGMLFVQQKTDYEKAMEAFNQALKLDGNYWQAKLNIANVYGLQKKNEQAESQYKELLRNQAKNPQVNSYYTRFLLANGRNDEAVKNLENVVAQNPEEIALARVLIGLYEQEGKKDKLDQQLARLEQNEKTKSMGLHMRGQMQLRERNATGAISTYESFVSSFPDSALGNFQLARAYVLDKKLSSAKDSLAKTLKLNPEYTPAMILQVQIALSEKDFKVAKNTIDELIKRDENSSVGYELMGDYYAMQNKHDLAIKQYAVALKHTNESATLYLKHARSVANLNGEDKALAALEEAVGKVAESQRPTIQAELVKTYHKSKNKTKILKTLTDLNAASLNNPALLNDMAWYAHYYDLKLAEDLSSKAYELRNDLAAIKDTYGWILLKNGKNGKALELLKSASEMAPKSEEIRYHLAVAYFESDMKAAANDLFMRINASQDNFEGRDQVNGYLNKLN